MTGELVRERGLVFRRSGFWGRGRCGRSGGPSRGLGRVFEVVADAAAEADSEIEVGSDGDADEGGDGVGELFGEFGVGPTGGGERGEERAGEGSEGGAGSVWERWHDAESRAVCGGTGFTDPAVMAGGVRDFIPLGPENG